MEIHIQCSQLEILQNFLFSPDQSLILKSQGLKMFSFSFLYMCIIDTKKNWFLNMPKNSQKNFKEAQSQRIYSTRHQTPHKAMYTWTNRPVGRSRAQKQAPPKKCLICDKDRTMDVRKGLPSFFPSFFLSFLSFF